MLSINNSDCASLETLRHKQSNKQPTNTINPINNNGAINDEYVSAKRKDNGLIERLYNKIKNLTGLGVGTKKVDAAIAKLQKGEITNEEAEKTLHDYSSSQETAAQVFGDGVSIAAGAGVFFGLGKKAKKISSIVKINGIDKLLYKIGLPSNVSNILKSIAEPILTSNKKLGAVLIGLSALSAGFAKYWTLKFNRIGSKEFKIDEEKYGNKKERTTIQKFEAKEAKKALKKERRKTNFKNFVSGMLNGLMLPVTTIGGFIGAPLYVAANSLNRYFVANKTDKKKSAKGYVDNLKNAAVTTGVMVAAVAIPLAIKGNKTRILDKNLKIVTENLQKAKLQDADFAGKSAFEELQSTLLNSNNISSIMHGNMSVEEQITKLTEENIFAVKFKQISSDGSTLTKALRENCPPTRTLEETQEFVRTNLGEGYNVIQLLGVGTVAETYLAKNAEGKEVCIKMLKKGITQEKIQKDKQKFIELVNNMTGKSQEEKEYLLRNIDDLADGISKEIDLSNEMEAAKQLVPHTKTANVVKPIEVKNGLYVMEKANGISLASFVELNEAKLYKEMLENDSPLIEIVEPRYGSKLYNALEGKYKKEEELQAIQDYIKKIEARTPEYGDISINEADTKYLINEYIKVLTEQFYKVDKNGKVLHADIHPGNIFIDVEALRSRKGKVFTLIDTGNTVNQTAEQSINAINLTSYIKNANVPDIATYVLDGAHLPQGMTKEEAIKNITNELNKCFFDNKTSLEKMTNEKVLTLASKIMQKYKIIPNDTQLNFNKARQSANNSMMDLIETILKQKLKNLNINIAEQTGETIVQNGKNNLLSKIKNKINKMLNFTKGAGQVGGTTASIGKDALLMKRRYNNLQAAQEKLNLRQMTPAQRIKQKHNPNSKPSNSVDYLTYELKQYILD